MLWVKRVGALLADLVFLMRPPLLCASCTFFFAGVAASMPAGVNPYSAGSVTKGFANLGIYILVVAFAFVVNQISDIASDAMNRKGFILPTGLVGRAERVGFAVLILAVAGAIGFASAGVLRLLVWTGLVLGLVYSLAPVRLKGRPIWDMAANVAGFGFIGFAMGWLAWAHQGVRMVVHAVPYAFAMGAIFLNTCIPDAEGDRASGDRTSCVAFGPGAVSRAAVVLLAFSVTTALVLHEGLCYIAAAGSLPAFVAVAARPDHRHSVLCSQFAGRLFLVVVGIRAPVLLGLVLLTYVASRAYYGKRFGIKYPRLEGACRQ
jgi:4-hydroxybenzoate polyprenyltransferase